MKLNGTIMKTVGSLVSKAKVNSPTICLVGGLVCLGAGAYFWHQAGRHIDEKLDESKEQIDNLKAMKEAGEYEDVETGEMVEFTVEEYKKELTHAYVVTSIETIKLYGPAVLCTVGAGVCFVTGNQILAKRLAGMTAAYSAAQKAYMRYRKNVVEDLGEDADRKYLLGLDAKHREKYYDTKIDEKTGEVVNIGKAKIREFDVVSDVKDWRQASPYAVETSKCGGFTKDYQYNIMFLESLEKKVNATLDWKGYVSLYEVYEMLGCLNNITSEAEKMAHQVGWVKGYGDGDVRFNLVMVPTTCYIADGVAGNLSEVGLIDFNCIGSIWDKI